MFVILCRIELKLSSNSGLFILSVAMPIVVTGELFSQLTYY